jgi:FAD dependent oxidoreductase TIGR03364
LFDIAIVGAGILGLAHALAARRAGLRVVVVEREARAIGASVRNFGFITVTGQERGITWRRAMRSRHVWADIAPHAGIHIEHRHMLMVARRPEALAVLEEFAATEMGVGCSLLFGPALPPELAPGHAGALFSPHEIRVESRTAIPKLAAWLEGQGVAFRRLTAVHGVEPGVLHTTAGKIRANHIVVCPGPDLRTLFPDEIARREVTLCKLHMLRLANPGFRLPAAVMSDLGLVRYLGYNVAPSLPALRARLQAEQPGQLADGIHLIAVQSEDGSLVVGDSHHYDPSPDPFQPRAVDDRILDEFAAVFGAVPEVIERWTGVYPSSPGVAFHATPMPDVRLVMVTSGTGASTAFAIAEETLAVLLGQTAPEHAR